MKDLVQHLEEEIKIDKIQKVVVGAVIKSNNLVLLMKRQADDFMGGLVELPSGGVDRGEKLLDALKREVFEETGLIITNIVGYIGHFDYTSGSGKKARQLNFLVKTETNAVKLNASEHSEFYFIEPKEKNMSLFNISDKTKKIILASNRNLF